jgi:hypothetical protein
MGMTTIQVDNETHEKLQLLAIWYKKQFKFKGKFPITNVIGKLIEEWESTHGKITENLVSKE